VKQETGEEGEIDKLEETNLTLLGGITTRMTENGGWLNQSIPDGGSRGGWILPH
jgi:hypothetical protein